MVSALDLIGLSHCIVSLGKKLYSTLSPFTQVNKLMGTGGKILLPSRGWYQIFVVATKIGLSSGRVGHLWSSGWSVAYVRLYLLIVIWQNLSSCLLFSKVF